MEIPLFVSKKKLKHIELFAGCGGMSLGLEAAGYDLIFANELSPMAAETFAFNFFDEDLDDLAKKQGQSERVIWINSRYENLTERLRENPLEFPEFGDEGFSDLSDDIDSYDGKLLIGSIRDLNALLSTSEELGSALHNSFGRGELTLVSGGPPCQSFSMAGARKKDCDKNTLPWEFVSFVNHTKPKFALLENVTGILRAFQDDDGEKFHAWYEVAKAFASINYVPLCLHINAKYAGIAQNRPRFILLAIREDIYNNLIDHNKLGTESRVLLESSLSFFNMVKEHGVELDFGHLQYFDVDKNSKDFKNTFLSILLEDKQVTVQDAIDDLRGSNVVKSDFVINLNNTFSLSAKEKVPNHELRRNSELVQRRFRLYQVLQQIGDRAITKEVFSILKGESEELSTIAWEHLSGYEFLQISGSLEKFEEQIEFIEYLKKHPTKKQTQRALAPNLPAPAALSIPDDACHYHRDEIRTLTVREMARIQSFPDDFEFRSKVTTGGQMRRYEVPQYTQVGNAVPPILGRKLGQIINYLDSIVS